MRTNHDDTEWAIQRKQRSQTEGLAMFDGLRMPMVTPCYEAQEAAYAKGVPNPPNEYMTATSHPDSVAGNSQNGRILKHLQTVGPLTSLDALTLFGCSRLAARIADLRSRGYLITSTLVDVGGGKRVASYAMRV